MTPKRLDAQDTVETAIHFLSKLQSEGWSLDHLEQFIEYATLSKKGVRTPVEAVVKITLRPIRG